MTDKAGEAVRAILERTRAELVAAGLTPEDADTLMAVQSIIRVERIEDLEAFIRLARESIECLTELDTLH